MSLDDWLKNGWLTAHSTSKREIQDLLGVADRDLADCRIKGLSADWRMSIAYNAALQLTTAALAAAGFRASRDAHHFRVIQSLEHTIGADSALVDQLEAFRKKRNLGSYERAGMVSDKEAKEMIALAECLRKNVVAWLHAAHPKLLKR